MSLSKLKKDVNKKFYKNFNVFTKAVYNGIKDKTPVDTGELKDSLTIKDISINKKEIAFEDNEYATYVEHGMGQPYVYNVDGGKYVGEGAEMIKRTMDEIPQLIKVYINLTR